MLIAFVVFARIAFLSLFFVNIGYAKDSVSVGVVNVTFLMENAPQAEVASSNFNSGCHWVISLG